MKTFLTLFALLVAANAIASDRPNVIFILVDDLGYADVGAYGNVYHRTPNIDRLARQGMRFTDAYAAAPNCSPTRSSILTGKWPARTGVTQYLPGNVLPYASLLQAELPDGLPLTETIIAQPLGKAGYATASIGKWHLGGDEYLPQNRGFGLNFAGDHFGSHQTMFAPHSRLSIPDAQPGDYLTDRLTSESERFIEANRDKPFFLYLPLYSVHAPIQGKAERIAHYESAWDPSGRNNAAYAAMVEGVDHCVGRLVVKLEELKLTERTVILFFSDNGGVEARAFNGGFRRGKGWLYEAGIREPLIVKWPGVVEPGSVSNTPVSSVDFYPTILEMTGAPDTDSHASDGVSLVPLLKGAGGLNRDVLYWHYPHYSNAGSPPAGAIREGDWKLIEFFDGGIPPQVTGASAHTENAGAGAPSSEGSGYFRGGRLELYNLARDPSEQHDAAPVLPGKAKALHKKLLLWRESVNARMPRDNPDYDQSKANQKRAAKSRWTR